MTFQNMNHYGRTIAETTNNNDQKVFANNKSIQRSGNDIDADTPSTFTRRVMIETSMGGYR